MSKAKEALVAREELAARFLPTKQADPDMPPKRSRKKAHTVEPSSTLVAKPTGANVSNVEVVDDSTLLLTNEQNDSAVAVNVEQELPAVPDTYSFSDLQGLSSEDLADARGAISKIRSEIYKSAPRIAKRIVAMIDDPDSGKAMQGIKLALDFGFGKQKDSSGVTVNVAAGSFGDFMRKRKKS